MDINSVITSAEEISTELTSEIASEVATEAGGFIGTFFTDFAQGAVDFASKITSPDPESIMNVLEVMGMGMLGIFCVTGVIILIVSLLNKAGSAPKKDNENK